MTFAAGEEGHHGAPLTGLRHREQRVAGSTASLQRRVSTAARTLSARASRLDTVPATARAAGANAGALRCADSCR